MNLRIEVRAAVPYDGRAIVDGVEQAGKNHSGGDAEQEQHIDIIRSQDHFEISPDKRVEAMVGDNDVTSFGRNVGMNCARCSLEQFLMLD